jgi:hypothetical protein
MARRLGMALLLPQKGVAIVCAPGYARRECVFTRTAYAGAMSLSISERSTQATSNCRSPPGHTRGTRGRQTALAVEAASVVPQLRPGVAVFALVSARPEHSPAYRPARPPPSPSVSGVLTASGPLPAWRRPDLETGSAGDPRSPGRPGSPRRRYAFAVGVIVSLPRGRLGAGVGVGSVPLLRAG